jgi:ATP-dependent DNA ligase
MEPRNLSGGSSKAPQLSESPPTPPLLRRITSGLPRHVHNAHGHATQHSSQLKINGELVVWTGDRLDFDALQLRMVNTAATVRRRLAPAQPASFVAFDVLAIGSVDVRAMRWTVRRRRLESLAGRWVPPLQVSPVTADADEARWTPSSPVGWRVSW